MRQAISWAMAALSITSSFTAHAEQVSTEAIMRGTRYETFCYTKAGTTPGGKLFIIGGCHGDEVAGYLAARRLKDWPITTGTLLLITDAHVAAIKRNERGYPGNMNNMFPGNSDGDSMERLAYGIWSLIVKHKPQMLVTLHESVGFHRIEPTRYGQTLTYDTHKLDDVFRPMVESVNQQISNADHHFSLFVAPFPTCPTYCAYFKLGIPATSVETCRQMELEERVEHQLMMCRAFMHANGLRWEENPQASTQNPVPVAPQTEPSTASPTQPFSARAPETAASSNPTPATAQPVSPPQAVPATSSPTATRIQAPDRANGRTNIVGVFCLAAGAGFLAFAVTALVIRRR